ncbi:hypothetical protein [Streptomyces chartreusis]
MDVVFLSLVFRYSVCPAESVSQMPAAPFAVFRTNFEPESLEFGAAEAVVEPESAEFDTDEGAFESASDESVEELLHAAANVARAARERPKPSVRGEVVRSMTILIY